MRADVRKPCCTGQSEECRFQGTAGRQVRCLFVVIVVTTHYGTVSAIAWECGTNWRCALTAAVFLCLFAEGGVSGAAQWTVVL